MNSNQFLLKIAETEEEKTASQRLRYDVFVREFGAQTSDENHRLKLEKDVYDEAYDHLILVDKTITDPKSNVVGVYRLLRGTNAQKNCGFYTESEYDLETILGSDRRVLELGRSCVHPDYREGVALFLLWNSLAEYVEYHKIEVLFGVASFHGTDTSQIAQSLSFLHHNYLAPPELRAVAKETGFADMNLMEKENINKLEALRSIPSVMKSYLRLGGFVGQGAYIDYEFNTVDVCMLVDTKNVSAKHKSLYLKDRK